MNNDSKINKIINIPVFRNIHKKDDGKLHYELEKYITVPENMIKKDKDKNHLH